MRRPPLNYLITVVLGGLLWVATAIAAGQRLGDSVVLQEMTTEEFVATYRTVLGVTAAAGVAGCLAWYFYGGRDAVAARLADARRTWTLLFVVQLGVAVAALATMAVLFSGESLTGGNYAVIFLLLALQTVLLFWACSLLLSPRAVEYVPWGKR